MVKKLKTEEEKFGRKITEDDLNEPSCCLTSAQKNVFILYYHKNLSCDEIAIMLNWSKFRVKDIKQSVDSRLLSWITRQPRVELEKARIEEYRSIARIDSELYNIAIEELELPDRVYAQLKRALINSVGELAKLTKKEFLQIRSVGISSLLLVNKALKKYNIQII